MTEFNYNKINILRFICVCLLILCTFGIPLNFWNAISPELNFAPCVLFSIYGFLIYRHHIVNYSKYITKHFLAILISVIGYLPFSLIFEYLSAGSISHIYSKKSIIEFFVLNNWISTFGSGIWIILSSFYALIILAVLDKIKLLKFDYIICFFLFIVTLFTGEFSSLVPFKFFGYDYLSANFFTRALPYMLLGKIICDHRQSLRNVKNVVWEIILVLSVAICYFEIFLLDAFEKLVYKNHLLGFIPITFVILVLAVRSGSRSGYKGYDYILRVASFAIYITYSIVGYALFYILYYFGLPNLFNFIGLATLLLCVVFGILVGTVSLKIKIKKEKKEALEDEI